MRWLSGAVLALGLGLATGAAAGGCPEHGGRHHNHGPGGAHAYAPGAYDRGGEDLFDGRRYDRPGTARYSDRRDDDFDAAYPPRSDDRYVDRGYDDRAAGRYDDDARMRDDWIDGDEFAGDDRFGPPVGASPWYRDGRRPAPICACDEIRLSGGFFNDAGGVGPIPMDGGYGGGFVAFGDGSGFSRASSRAFSSAQASASASARVIVHRGGFRGHGGKGHGGKGH